ncbi:Cytochrome c [Salinimicrobium catena]|uniref:Cytochrome c n=1 Tax=Salinimicrobium catena TaxID=390640 RepID=A0A1H5HHD0_9FLAO|nr:c-type cytochrome [Salinimicrobium catena]SDK70157.1 Cytochrome c [Salinimicrobium catena]SEE27357.1 Cytochrome c [Salinimicrobium catena]
MGTINQSNHRLLKEKDLLYIFLLSIPFILSGCQEKNYAKTPDSTALQEVKTDAGQEDLLKRGKYLVTSIGCADCHSPKRISGRGPEEIPELKLSGYQQGQELPAIDQKVLENGWILFSGDLTAAVGPWGVSFAANLTSDETGIGNWSYKQFETAIRKGKYKGMENGRDMLPPMPWPAYAHLSDEDLQAMFAYLQSTEPIQNAVPAPIPRDKLTSLQSKK